MSDGRIHITIEEIPELRESLDRFSRAVEQFNALRGLVQEWYTEEQACELKNIPYHSLRQHPNRRYLPNFGRRTEVRHKGHNRWMYPREQVVEWLSLTEAQIDELWEKEIRRERIAG
jgi:hypothetical protein